MNSFAGLCEAYGADITAVREGVASDSRIGASYLFAGIGFGGSTLTKDLETASRLAKAKGLPAELFDAIAAINVFQEESFVRRVLDFYGDGIVQKRIAVWGAAFKPRTDDLHSAPALRVIDALLEAGASVCVYDPTASAGVRERYGDRVTIAAKSYAALEDADGLVITTEWNEFRRPDYERMAGLMRQPVIFDGRNLYTPKVMEKYGFRYISIGRPSV